MSCYLSSLYVSSLSSKLLPLVLKLLPSRLCVCLCTSSHLLRAFPLVPSDSSSTLSSLSPMYIYSHTSPTCMSPYVFPFFKQASLGFKTFFPSYPLYFFPLTFFSSPNPSSLLPKFLPFYIILVSEPYTHLCFFSLVL
jgi:hypothetical protein